MGEFSRSLHAYIYTITILFLKNFVEASVGLTGLVSFFLEGVFVCGWIFDFSRYQHWHIVISWFNNNLVILDDRISFFFFKE